MKDSKKLDLARFDEAVPICRKLVSVQSYSGKEDGVVATLKVLFAALPCDEIHVDEYGSIVATIKGDKPGPKVLFDAHIDTVPVEDESAWYFPPFGGVIDSGRIYGRGTSDMKGALAAMIAAARQFTNELGKHFGGEINIAGVVHEECFEGVAARKISERVKPDYVIIGEASELNLKCGQRGRAEIVAETFGKSAHSANPEKGVNAVYKMAKLIEKIQALPCSEHPVLGKGILELTDIKSSPYPGASVVPDYCRATFDRRLLVGETPESVLAPLRNLVGELAGEDSDFHAEVSFAQGKEACYTGAEIGDRRFFPAWLYNREDPFVQDVFQSLRGYGLDPVITQYSFCTNGSHYAGEAGIKTVGFGPSPENLAHIVDEYVEIDQLRGAALGYYAIMDTLLAQS